jgi:hypothetical protein
MLLPLPRLDDTRWTDLVEESRSLIPVYAPEWTDHNVSDPGITLIDLFSWVAEMQVFELDQVPPRHRRRFLALVGVHPEPPRPAHVVLRFTLPAGSEPVRVPAGTVCATSDDDDPVLFRTSRSITVAAVGIAALRTQAGDATTDLTARFRRGEPLAVLGDDPEPGATLAFDLDAPLPIGWHVGLWATPAAEGGGADSRTVWEIRVGPDLWRTLDPDAEEVRDETAGLTADGPVEFAVPAAMHADAAGNYGLRCRFAGGRYDDAPLLAGLVLGGVRAQQSVRASVPEPDESGMVELGRGTGGPGQSVTLSPGPVDAATVRLRTRAGNPATGWRDWTIVPDLESARPHDAHAVLDATSGELSFGDGEHGLAPPDGAVIAVTHRWTRAENGNVAAGTVDRLAGPPYNLSLDAEELTVVNPAAAIGGSAAETLEHSEGRAAERVSGVTRAVTLDDLGRLALGTPGVRLARAEARANLHPALPCVTATGVLTVIVVPYLPRGRPLPGRGLLRRVAAHLNAHRVIGSRIEVAGPQYTEVAVHARVRPQPLADPDEVRRRASAALDAFFNPLSGGQDGTGWPFGRDVASAEVLRVIDDVSGVDHVLELALVGADGASCGNLCIGPLGLVDAGAHQIEVVSG